MFCKMSRLLIRKSIAVVLVALALVLSTPHAQAASSLSHGVGSQTTSNNHPFCKEIGTKVQVSAGARMWCFGPQSGNAVPQIRTSLHKTRTFGPNVDAANPAEDVSPSGVQ